MRKTLSDAEINALRTASQFKFGVVPTANPALKGICECLLRSGLLKRQMIMDGNARCGDPNAIAVAYTITESGRERLKALDSPSSLRRSVASSL